MIDYSITYIKNYPQDGNHLQCNTSLPFNITKGIDGFFYFDKNGKEKKYNIFLNKNGKVIDKIDDRWIVVLDDSASEELKSIFNVKVSKDLNKIIKYCKVVYLKSLKLQLKNIKNEIKLYS